MEKANIMVVDDSALMRRIISEIIREDESLTVSATAPNGKIALDKIQRSMPDLITLDIEMPGMDGLSALKEIRKINANVPIIICSTLTRSGGEVTLEALLQGASDYITKSPGSNEACDGFKTFQQDLIAKIKSLLTSNERVKARTARPSNRQNQSQAEKAITVSPGSGDLKIVAIGVSTGGPAALSELMPLIPANLPVPILIVQHMPKIFTNILANSLDTKTDLTVVEAREGDILSPGKVWIAPGDYHMTVVKNKNQYQLTLNQDPPVQYCRPAVDVMLKSVAHCYGSQAMAIILTGMGKDGLEGCQAIKRNEGTVLVQDEASSVVWGMPGAVAKAGIADQILPLLDIPDYTVAQISKASTHYG